MKQELLAETNRILTPIKIILIRRITRRTLILLEPNRALGALWHEDVAATRNGEVVGPSLSAAVCLLMAAVEEIVALSGGVGFAHDVAVVARAAIGHVVDSIRSAVRRLVEGELPG